MPAFSIRPKEAEIIGRLLAGYGELEFIVYECVKVALGRSTIAARLLFRVRSEKTRLDIADAILREVCDSYELTVKYTEAISAAHYCRKIRNQYAHCHWIGDESDGLFFANIEPSAEKKSGEIILAFNHVDDALLARQEAFFANTQVYLWWLQHELRVRAGSLPSHNVPTPKQRPQPPLHNPPEEHPLPKRLKDNRKPEE